MKYHLICPDYRLYTDFTGMIQELLRRGHDEAAVFHDVSDGMLEADALLFFGDMSIVEKFDALMRSAGPSRPRAALWHLEPLGPASMRVEKGTCEYGMAQCWWPELLPSWLSFLKARLDHHAPGEIPRRNRWVRYCRRYYAARMKKKLRQDGYDSSRVGWRDLFYLAYRQRQLTRHFQDPWLDVVVGSTPSRADLLHRLNIPAAFVPVGWHPAWGEPLEPVKRDIDVLFLGHLHRNHCGRTAVLKSLENTLAARGRRLRFISKACYGRERTELLNRTKILLDVVRLPWEIPNMRLLIGMSCGAMVMSTGLAGDSRPYRQGEHFVEAPPEVLAEQLMHYLDNEAERERIARRGQRFVLTENTLERSLEQIGAVLTGIDRGDSSAGVLGDAAEDLV